MPLLNPAFVTTVVPQRPTDDGMGNTTWADLPSVSVLVWSGGRSGGAHAVTMGGSKGPSWTQFAQVFVPRGADLQSGDRIPYQGLQFVISGTPSGDQMQPFTGHDFGWMAFEAEGHQ